MIELRRGGYVCSQASSLPGGGCRRFFERFKFLDKVAEDVGICKKFPF